ncbi:MAG: UbiA family prenyltransferase [Planctomycetota bacterium]
MTALVRLCRLYYAVPMALACLLTMVYARGGDMDGHWMGDLLATVALAFVIAAGYVLNDVVDVRIDRVNAPRRPVASGRVGRTTAGWFGAGLLVAGLVVACFTNPAYLVMLSAVALLLVIYDLTSKRLGVGKQVLVAVLMTSIYPLALARTGWPGGPRAPSLVVFPIWLLLTSFAYEVLKDLRDAGGDSEVSGRTSHLQRRPGLWRRIASVTILVAVPLLVLPLWLGCGVVYLLVATPAAALGVVSVLVDLRRAIMLVYAEVFGVGLAALADVMVYG